MTSKRYLIIGGVAGGMSAATRLRRLDEHAQITVLERGGHVSFANCGLPYHLGGVIEERSSLLLQTPASLGSRFGLDVRVRTEAVHRLGRVGEQSARAQVRDGRAERRLDLRRRPEGDGGGGRDHGRRRHSASAWSASARAKSGSSVTLSSRSLPRTTTTGSPSRSHTPASSVASSPASQASR